MSNIELEDDIVLAKFINYMQKALYHKRLNYYRDFERMRECEVSINDIYLLNLHYKYGLSYIEISKITGEKVCTLKQRRNRALAKLKKKLED